MVTCPKCARELPEESKFCFSCGADLAAGDAKRTSFAVRPNEPVRSFKLVSTIMPKGAGEHPRTYQVALGIALVASIAAAALGALPIALLLAAFSIPIVYIVYLYDVNLWEDAPVPVTMLAFGLSFVLGLAFTWGWVTLRANDYMIPTYDGSAFAPTMKGVLVMVLLVPIVGEIIRQIGPVLLAARPEFDDLMDGLTFGVISGVAFSTADTLVKHWDLLVGGFAQPGVDALTYTSLFVLEGFVKPLVIGSATGLAAAEFSGLGHGHDGYTPRYFRAVIEAIAWNVAYFGGTYLLSFVVPAWGGLVASIVLGLILLGALILRLRTIMQVGLMEAALEDAARDAGIGEDGELVHCRVCEMPKQPSAAFCSHCGTATRSTSDRKAQLAAVNTLKGL